MRSRLVNPAVVTAVYLALGVVWMLLAERVLRFMASDDGLLERLQGLEDWLFLLVTAAGLYVLVRAGQRRLVGQLAAQADREQRFRDLVESTTDWIWEVGTDGVYTYCSPNVEQMLGYRPDEVIGRTPFDLMPDSEATRVSAAFADIVAARQPFSGLLNDNRHRDGHLVTMETSGVPIFDRAGGLAGYRGIDRDVTQRRQIELALREREQRYRAVFNQQFQFMALLTPDGVTLEINDLPLRVTGTHREDYVGRPFWLTPAWENLPEWHEIWPRRIVEAMRSDGAVLTEDVFRGPDGAIRYADAATTAIRDDDGKVTFILVQATDTTARRETELQRDRLLDSLQQLNTQLDQKVRERTAELLAANRELESFTYAVSHDLRAPIRAIDGFRGALEEDYGEQLPAGARDYLAEIALGAERMNTLIEGLLDLSRSTRGQLVRSVVDLEPLVRELHVQCSRNYADRDVVLQVTGPLLVNGDQRLLRTLMQNLLENAWKYATPGHRSEVQVEGLDLDGSACVCVRDNGIGFDPAFAEKLFEPFQRLHRQDEVSGIGIGLATAARIVNRHGGMIAGCGRLGKGARFCFTL